MKLSKIFIILFTSLNAYSQNTLESTFRELYPTLGDFLDEVYIEDVDTCILLFDLLIETPKYLSTSDTIQIESQGLVPLRTTIEEITNGHKKRLIKEDFFPISNPEIHFSPRRIFKSIEQRRITPRVEKFCQTNNYDPFEKFEKKLLGIYNDQNENRFIQINNDEIKIFEETRTGYNIKIGKYEIINDYIISNPSLKYKWEEDRKELLNVTTNLEYEFKMNCCYFLKDCNSRHITYLMFNLKFKKEDENKQILEIEKLIDQKEK